MKRVDKPLRTGGLFASPDVDESSRASKSSRCPATPWHWLLAGYAVFFVGFAVSLLLRCAGRPFLVEDAILSDLLSRIDNPRGYWAACLAVMVGGFLLLPVAAFVSRRLNSMRSWAFTGAWLYRLGLWATVVVGVSTPFQQPYVPIHLYLSFFVFMSLVGGLAVCLGTAARSVKIGRPWLRGLAGLMTGLLLFLAYLLVTPEFFQDRREWLAVSEWGLCGAIAVGTVALTRALGGPKVREINTAKGSTRQHLRQNCRNDLPPR